MESYKIAAAEEEPLHVPVSPIAQYFNSSVLSIVVIGVLETEVPIDDSQTIPLLKNMLLPINPRFSSIMVDKKGVKQWKKVEVQLKDHVKVPIFPAEMTPEFYEKCQHDYISQIGMEPLSQHRPLWEIHLFKYPTCNAAGTIIFKLHHALGDGFSLMGALLSCLQRADDPSHPLTFPSVTTQPILLSEKGDNGLIRNVPKIVSSIFNSATDFCRSLKSSLVEDRQTPIRSGSMGVAYGPVRISTIIFSLHQIKQIKTKLGVTVNDVITGVIFLGSRLYMQSVSQESSTMDSTAVLMLNIRMLRSYSSVKEMLKPDSKSPWGNHFAILQMPIPKLTDAELSNPLEFIKKAHEIIKGKRSSFGVYLTAMLLDIVKKFRGPEAAAKYVYRTLNNSSMAITNMIGPLEKVALANHPIKGFYFMVFGSPQSLVISLVSYMGQLRVAIGSADGFIDSQKLKSCMEDAFDMILKAV